MAHQNIGHGPDDTLCRIASTTSDNAMPSIRVAGPVHKANVGKNAVNRRDPVTMFWLRHENETRLDW
jgi:hypothetical protein